MKNLNICIDIDGTITDAYYWLEYANEYFNKNITKKQVTEYYIDKVMGVDRTEYEEFYEKNKIKMHVNPKIRNNVKTVLEKLSLFHRIYFVTAREKELTLLTHLFLRKNGLPYDELFVLGNCNKVNTARELNCSLFIEDSYNNAIQLSNAGFKVLLIDTNYNRKTLNDNITRVYSWKEIFSIINKLSLQNEVM